MSSTSSRGPGEACLPIDSSNSGQSVTSKTSRTAKRSPRRGFKTAALILPPSSGTSGSSFEQATPESTEALRTWLRQVFPALRSPWRENVSDGPIPATSGLKPLRPFAKYNHDSHSWRMSRDFSPLQVLMGEAEEPLPEYSQTWPQRGSMRSGVCWELPMLERRTGASGCGYWPTPRGTDGEKGGPNQRGSRGDQMLPSAVMWPTPKGSPSGPDYARANRPESGGDDLMTAVARGGSPTRQTYPSPNVRDVQSVKKVTRGKGSKARGNEIIEPLVLTVRGDSSGQLNPDWVEWLMGWPIGWTALGPLATDRFQRWLRLHGKC